jgi:hypothetical protein
MSIPYEERSTAASNERTDKLIFTNNLISATLKQKNPESYYTKGLSNLICPNLV